MADLPKDFSPSHPDWGIPSKMNRWRLQGGEQLMQDHRVEKVAKLESLYTESPSQDKSKLITSKFESNKPNEPAQTVSTPSSPFAAAGFVREPSAGRLMTKPVPKPEMIKKVSKRDQTAKLSKKRQKS